MNRITAETQLVPKVDLLNAASRYLRVESALRAAQDSMEVQLFDYVREHFPIIENPWHSTSYHAVWEHGLPTSIDVVQTYTDEHGSSSQTFRINLVSEF